MAFKNLSKEKKPLDPVGKLIAFTQYLFIRLMKTEYFKPSVSKNLWPKLTGSGEDFKEMMKRVTAKTNTFFSNYENQSYIEMAFWQADRSERHLIPFKPLGKNNEKRENKRRPAG